VAETHACSWVVSGGSASQPQCHHCPTSTAVAPALMRNDPPTKPAADLMHACTRGWRHQSGPGDPRGQHTLCHLCPSWQLMNSMACRTVTDAPSVNQAWRVMMWLPATLPLQRITRSDTRT
jgi:hypothetical protein